MYRRRLETELLFWTIRLSILFLLPLHVSDIGIYRGDVSRYLTLGQWPYRDFGFEYPPLTFGVLLMPALLADFFHLVRDWDYRFFLALLILPFDYALFRGFLRNPPIPRAAFLYVAFTALLPHLLFDRLDLVVAAGIALPFLMRGRPRDRSDEPFVLGWGLAAALKLVPLLLLPFRLGEGTRAWPRWFRLSFFTAGPILASTFLVILLSGGPISFLSYHGARGVQVESLLGNLFLSLHAGGLSSGVDIVNAFRSQQVSGVPGLVTAGKFLFWIMLGVAYAAALFAVFRRGFSALRASWLFLLTFVTFGYVLSPQFFFWLIPLSLLVAAELKGKARGHFLLLFFLILLFTGVHFEDYWNYANQRPLNIYWLSARNALLLGFWVMNWIWFRAKPGSADRPNLLPAGY